MAVDCSYATYGTGACALTTNVGSTPKGNGKWGQSDLGGNVWERMLDWRATPYASGACVNCANTTLSAYAEAIRRGGATGEGTQPYLRRIAAHTGRPSTIPETARAARDRVQIEERALDVIAFCQDRGIQLVVEVAPDQPEDISDVDRALLAQRPAVAAPKIGRNEPCPCGSGRKFKKCCEGVSRRLPHERAKPESDPPLVGVEPVDRGCPRPGLDSRPGRVPRRTRS